MVNKRGHEEARQGRGVLRKNSFVFYASLDAAFFAYMTC